MREDVIVSHGGGGCDGLSSSDGGSWGETRGDASDEGISFNGKIMKNE